MRMEEVLEVDVLDTEGGGRDLSFRVPGLTAQLSFDTYYFVLANEPSVPEIDDVRRVIGDYLMGWVTVIDAMSLGETRCFPIDVSDQYSGCLMVKSIEGGLELNYGISSTCGWALDLNDIRKCSRQILDCRADIPESLQVEKTTLVKSISRQAERLKRGLRSSH